MVSSDYAGDLSAAEAWALLEKESKAQLIDVRTTAEWTFVGGPDVSPLGRQTICVEWQMYPDMAVNPEFAKVVAGLVQRAGANETTPLLFLCRSGARSRAAAMAMTHAGYGKSYNVAGGFEGDLDDARHRGQRNGWKAQGLPWRQS